MAETRNYLDFEIIKEHWNKYALQDGSKLKTRVTLNSVWSFEKDGKKNYSIDTRTDFKILCNTSLQGEKSQTVWTQEDLAKNIEIEHCPYDTISYETNEYVLDDNTRILIHLNLGNVSRTCLYDAVGDRVYAIDANTSIHVTAPKQ